MPIVKTTKFIARKAERFFVYRVLSLDDTPHRIALGVAVGIFITWTPTIGLQMVLTVAMATLLGANKLVGVPFVWISNPATLFPIYAPNYWVGCKILSKKADAWRTIGAAVSFDGTWWERFTHWFTETSAIFWELWVGSLVMAIVLGMLTYFAVYRMIVVYRISLHKRHPELPQPETAEPSAGPSGPPGP